MTPWVLALVFLLSLAVRYWRAWDLVWHPDDALHYLIAIEPNWLYESLPDNHPPLYYGILHWVLKLCDADWAQRSIGIIAGSLTPLVVYQWLKERGEETGGWLALGILAFSPNLVDQSCQLRGYVPALFFASLALLFLERAIRQQTIGWMAASGLMLYTTMLTEHSAIFVAMGLGLHALLRWREMRQRLRWTWLAVQGGGLAVGVAIAWWIIRPYRTYVTENAIGSGYLSGAVWQPGKNPLLFAGRAIAAQFAFLGGGLEMGILFGLLGALGVLVAWRSSGLVLAPLSLGLILAFLQLHPFGHSRHSLLVGLFCVAAAAWGWQWLFARHASFGRALAVLLAAFIPILLTAHRQFLEGDAARRSLVEAGMKQALAEIPAGGKLLADRDTALLLRVYHGNGENPFTRWNTNRIFRVGPQQVEVFSRRWDFQSLAEIDEDAKLLGLSGERHLWLMDGGLSISPEQPPGARQLTPGLYFSRFSPGTD